MFLFCPNVVNQKLIPFVFKHCLSISAFWNHGCKALFSLECREVGVSSAFMFIPLKCTARVPEHGQGNQGKSLPPGGPQIPRTWPTVIMSIFWLSFYPVSLAFWFSLFWLCALAPPLPSFKKKKKIATLDLANLKKEETCCYSESDHPWLWVSLSSSLSQSQGPHSHRSTLRIN